MKRRAHRDQIDERFLEILNLLKTDMPLPDVYRDHQMQGQYKDCRDCHNGPDRVLIYRKNNSDGLELVRIGPHFQLAI